MEKETPLTFDWSILGSGIVPGRSLRRERPHAFPVDDPSAEAGHQQGRGAVVVHARPLPARCAVAGPRKNLRPLHALAQDVPASENGSLRLPGRLRTGTMAASYRATRNLLVYGIDCNFR